ncbi:MAG: biopolymer transporter ExbD [Phycisphaerales bacterium]|nr:biopolymer transporter ExbD [Phycisphaerales bacterium]
MATRVYQRGPVKVQANLTPLIDVVFLLITFFMLVAQIQRTRLEALDLPRLSAAETSKAVHDDSAVVNVLPLGPGGESRGYRVGARTFAESPDGLGALVDELKRSMKQQPSANVLVRAERTEMYERVHPLLAAIAQAGITRVHVVTVDKDGAL